MHDVVDIPESSRISLETLTERMRHRTQLPFGPDPFIVENVVTAVLDTLDGRLSPREAMLLREVAGLGRIIEEAKAGIAEVSVGAIRGSHIPFATGELGAIVEHTAMSTDVILESCEMLDTLATQLDRAQAGILQTATTQIYEACSFQDITGQRITKVVKALQAIETKVLELSAAYATLGVPAGPAPIIIPRPDDTAAEHAALLNGPMLPHEAMGQDDIDALLADF